MSWVEFGATPVGAFNVTITVQNFETPTGQSCLRTFTDEDGTPPRVLPLSMRLEVLQPNSNTLIVLFPGFIPRRRDFLHVSVEFGVTSNCTDWEASPHAGRRQGRVRPAPGAVDCTARVRWDTCHPEQEPVEPRSCDRDVAFRARPSTSFILVVLSQWHPFGNPTRRDGKLVARRWVRNKGTSHVGSRVLPSCKSE
jgi:hypothetical protein